MFYINDNYIRGLKDDKEFLRKQLFDLITKMNSTLSAIRKNNKEIGRQEKIRTEHLKEEYGRAPNK
jgi:hypothetical protein